MLNYHKDILGRDSSKSGAITLTFLQICQGGESVHHNTKNVLIRQCSCFCFETVRFNSRQINPTLLELRNDCTCVNGQCLSCDFLLR